MKSFPSPDHHVSKLNCIMLKKNPKTWWIYCTSQQNRSRRSHKSGSSGVGVKCTCHLLVSAGRHSVRGMVRKHSPQAGIKAEREPDVAPDFQGVLSVGAHITYFRSGSCTHILWNATINKSKGIKAVLFLSVSLFHESYMRRMEPIGTFFFPQP